MAEFPTISDDDVAFGKVAFCTPAPRQNKRRLGSGEDAAARMPFWAPERGGSARVDATAAEKRLVCKVYRKLNDWLGRRKGDFPGAPVLPNADWFASNPNGPIREIAAEPLGGILKYSGEVLGGDAVRRRGTRVRQTAGPSEEKRRRPGDKRIQAGWGSTYGRIKRRMESVCEPGRVNASRNLP